MTPGGAGVPVRPARSRARRWAARLLLVAAAGLALANVLAYRHARAFTRYAPAGPPPAKPEALSLAAKAGVVVRGVSPPRPAIHATPAAVGLPFTPLALPAGDGGSVAGWHVDHPAARGVAVLGHGYGACKSDLLAEAAGFHRLGYAAVLVDFRGSGDSSGSTTTFGAVTEPADLAAAARWAEARHPGKPVVLSGFSMGAAAVLKAVAGHGLVPAAVVLDAPFDRMLSAVRVRFRALGLPARPGADLLVFWGGVQHGFDAFAHNPADDAGAVTCPALVLYGSADPRATPDMARRVFDRLAGPKVLATVDGAGHVPAAKGDPARWDREVASLLGKVENRPKEPGRAGN